jgi:hypothetical protein
VQGGAGQGALQNHIGNSWLAPGATSDKLLPPQLQTRQEHKW